MKRAGSILLSAVLALFVGTGMAQAGSIYLTGHDVLLHSGQAGYDAIILDFLRAAGTPSEIVKADYSISVVGSGVGFGSFTGGDSMGGGMASGTVLANSGTLTGYGTATYFKTGTGADWGTILAADILVVMDHTSCGGCDVSDAGVAEILANKAAITTAFNAGMDIFGGSGADNDDYYAAFLPASAAATGASISASSGFVATAAGAALGIVSANINGYQTHNRFPTFDPAFTVFETRPLTSSVETISIGLRDAIITDGGIDPTGGTGGTDGTGGTVPEPATLLLLGAGLAGLRWVAGRKA